MTCSLNSDGDLVHSFGNKKQLLSTLTNTVGKEKPLYEKLATQMWTVDPWYTNQNPQIEMRQQKLLSTPITYSHILISNLKGSSEIFYS